MPGQSVQVYHFRLSVYEFQTSSCHQKKKKYNLKICLASVNMNQKIYHQIQEVHIYTIKLLIS